MDAPDLPSIHVVWLEGKLAAVHSDFLCGKAAVPDGMCWLAPDRFNALEVRRPG